MKNQHGITLIELMITLLVLAILMFIAAPHMSQVFAEMETKKVESNIRTLVAYTKQNAYIHRERLGICGSMDGESCHITGWSKKILVFKDNKVKNRLREPNETIVHSISVELKYGDLKWQGARAQNPVFQPDSGLPRGANGTFKYCSRNYKKHFNLLMSDMGHIRLEKQKDCVT